MWTIFILAALASILILYLPGYLFIRSAKISTITAISLAPLVSIAAYELLAIVYSKIDLFTSWVNTFALCTIVSFVVFVTRWLAARKRQAADHSFQKGQVRSDLLLMSLYIGIALLVAAFYFVVPLDGPASFSQESDNEAHLGYIQSFLQSGNYSSLEASLYHGIASGYESPSGDEATSFYPAAWHCVAAIVASLSGANAAIAANATLFTFISIVFPLSIFILLRSLSNNRLFLVCGSILSLAFASFPWGMISFGPLYPNMAAYCCVPLTVICFVRALNVAEVKEIQIKYLILFVVGLFALVFLQTNAVFTVAVLLIPFCFYIANRFLAEKRSSFKAVIFACLSLAIAIIWVVLYKAPFLQSVVSFSWEPFASVCQSLVNILFLSFGGSSVQIALAALVIMGFAYVMIKKKNRWLVVSYLLACILVLVTSAFSGEIRSLFTGFWYTDSHRIAGMAALAAIPLAAYGLYALAKLFERALVYLKALCGNHSSSTSKSGFVIFFVVIVAAIYYPSYALSGIGAVATPFGDFEARWHDENHSVNICIMDEEEELFLEKVSDTISNDDLIINIPDDGSVFAFGGYDLNTYYRRSGVAAIGAESEDSKIIRLGLNEYANNLDVKEAVERSGAKYLLVLDQGEDKEGDRYWFGHYNSTEWVGIDAITDETPGFKVILAEGDMRLYEIESVG